MVLSGEKKEEYRELTEYWKVRMANAKQRDAKTVTFSNGYAKNRRQMVVELQYIAIRQGITEWGAVKGTVYFVLHLGNVTSYNQPPTA